MTPVERFNRACLAAALVWLLATVPLGLIYQPTDSDFQQFYMGGLLLRLDEPRELYPIPDPNSKDNPGMNPSSRVRPRYGELQDFHKVPDITHWMLPPPAAVMFIPFSYLSFRAAEWLWVFVCIFSVWGVALIAGRINRRLVGVPSRSEGWLALLIVLSPMVIRSIRIRNCSAPIAFCFAVMALGLLRRETTRSALVTALAALLGALMKYATVVLFPLALAMRRRRTLLACAILGAAWLALSLPLTGTSSWRTFAADILPILDRPSGFNGNQTLHAMLTRLTKQKPLPPNLTIAMFSLQLAALLAVVIAMYRHRPEDYRERPELVLAACSALIAWIFITSPCAWEHWPVFFCPFWGYLFYEAAASGLRHAAVAASMVLMNLPLSILPNDGFLKRNILLPEPWNSTQLAGVLLVYTLALGRLALPPTSRQTRPRP